MKTIIHFFKVNNRFILFLFIFSCILILKNKIGYSNSWEDFVFHLDAPIWIFINAIFVFVLIILIKRVAERERFERFFSISRYLKFFGLGFICYLLLKNLFILLITILFDVQGNNMSSLYQITYEFVSQTVDFIIFGGFSLGYLYFKENSEYKRKLNAYELINSKSKIQQLKAQLNPHFLFNNLNILDQLIEEDQNKASDFLSHFSDLYRYALKSSEKEVISIQEELMFIENYFVLMEEKYRGYYKLIISEDIRDSNTIVPPFCLQVLVENAILHNLGTVNNPVVITITMENGINVFNNKVSNNKLKKGNGIALKNLTEQFKLLTNKLISIKETDSYFSITLPLINTNNND